MKFAPLNNLGHVGLAIFLFGWKSVDAAAPYWDSWFSSGEESEEKPDGFLVESPIINRRLEASVQTDWPSSPHNVLCEAFSFLKSDYDFLDRLAAQLQSGEVTPVDSYERAYQLVEELQPNRPLMQFALRMRAQSPHCELQRGLAQQQLMEHQEAKPLNIFAVVNGRVWASKPDWNQIASTGQQDSNSTLLPGETMHPSSKEDGPLVLLYGNLGSTEFAQWYSELVAANCCRVVVRHFGASATNTVALQGYGVRLDIRNVEYKVFDDVKSSVSATDELFNVSALDHVGSTNYLAGVNISHLMAGSSSQTMLDVQERLWKWHERQQHHSQIIPPRWQRRQLPLQAATVVAESTQIDRLLVFQDMAQNLPRVASTLVHVKIDPDVESWASAMEQSGFSPQRRSFLYVNGIPWNLKGPTVNVFELLNLLQEEEEKIGALQSRLSPVLPSGEALSKVQEAWMEGSDFWTSGDGDDSNDNESSLRIDVARGGKKAILYINDIEKDAQYAHWSSSLQQFLMSMQFGMPPSVRRNLFTVLAVMDPLATDPNVGVNLGLQLTKNSFPLRIGLILVGEKDLESCAEWMSQPRDDDDEPCPVDPFVWHTNDQALTLATLEDVPASAHAAFKLFAAIVSEFSKEMDNPADAYLEYWTPTLESHQRRNGGTITVKTLVSVHAELLDGMELMSHDEAVSHALSILGEDDGGDTDLTYGHALKFAVQKGVQPGMSFLNGRPLPSSSDESAGDKVGEVFMQEQSHIFQMIVKREITDRAPRSVYAKLLTGSNVYSKIHPLLTETTETSHLDLEHGFDHQSLLFPTSEESSSSEGACFVLEAVLQLDDRAGIVKAQNVVKIMKSFPSAIGDNEAIHVAFRILPSSVDGVSSAFCPILANAGLLGADNIEILFDKVLDNEAFTFDEPGALLDLVPDITAEVRQSILSSAPGPCASALDFIDGLPSKNFVVANGRYYPIEREQLSKQDVEFLLSIDIARTKAVTRLLDEFMSREDPLYYDGVARTAAFLATANAESKKSRVNVLKELADIAEGADLGENPLTFSWNTDDIDGSLKTRVTAVFDVATEAAQRVAPLLRVIRDDLQYPLTVVLAPKTLIDGDSKVPITSFYRFVADPTFSSEASPPKAVFENLPTNHVLTLRTDVPEPWDVQQKYSIQDTDNLRCELHSGCSDEESSDPNCFEDIPVQDREYLTNVIYGLNHLLFSGQCYESKGSPPNGLQLTLTRSGSSPEEERLLQDVEIGMDGSASISPLFALSPPVDYADTLVMKNIGYWQLRGNPGVWDLNIAEQSRGSEIFDMVKGTVRRGQIKLEPNSDPIATKTLVMKDFVTRGELLLVKRRSGYEKATLFYDREERTGSNGEEEVINVFSLATGHLYERFLKIMMLSVTKRTSSKVKFWLFENFLSPTFKASARAMSERIGCEVEFVTYKWPEWLRGQSEKQRIIWGYKILFLDVLFPLNVKKIIYVDADQVVRGDLKELWDMDLHGAPYGYTPFCTSRETTLGFQFWRSGFWESHLRGKPYHISALYVVDLQKFRKTLVGDQLRSIYQQLSADPNSLANLDQDLPNYAQHQVPIFSLPQEWLWCETWCSDETKATAKTIDLCNNPLHKEPKVSMAKRVISGELFNESWVELDAEVEMYDQEYRRSLDSGA